MSKDTRLKSEWNRVNPGGGNSRKEAHLATQIVHHGGKENEDAQKIHHLLGDIEHSRKWGKETLPPCSSISE